jgi:hypothetical protein
VQQLQAALQLEFAECDSDKRPFAPHLSIGQAKSDIKAQVLGEDIQSSIAKSVTSDDVSSAALDWHVDRVFVLQRKGYHGRFQVIGSVELGNSSIILSDRDRISMVDNEQGQI